MNREVSEANREAVGDTPRAKSDHDEDPWKVAGDHPESRCERCGGPNVWSWSAPSPLWNAVMRDPDTGADEYGIVCPPCFSEMASLKGLGGGALDGLPRWSWRFAPDIPMEEIAALWIDRSGRQWNPTTWLWEEPCICGFDSSPTGLRTDIVCPKHDESVPRPVDVFVESPNALHAPEERLPGGTDDTGDARPMCRPESHKDGKHSVLCLAGIMGYRQAADGWWDRIPADPLSIPGAVWTYSGRAYVRPAGRGVSLKEGARYEYLEDLPSGDYNVKVTFERIETTDD